MAIPLAVAVAMVGLWTFTRGVRSTGEPNHVTGEAASSTVLAKIAVQQGDLPDRFRKCSFSGDFVTHNEVFNGVNNDTYRSNLALWNRLKSQGATGAYIAYWGDTAEACDSVVTGPQSMNPHEPGKPHPSVVLSLVVSFVDEDAAAASYKSDTFQQSALANSADFQAREGDATGLGPNSLSASQPRAVVPIYQAVWQNGAVEVRFGSENLTTAESDAVASALNRRIG
ncbi:MAG: hypothetical protein M3256_10860 [Actinomycetota bacterium]|nr:hypothetical protein [Actinomycetota bacterium]